VSEQYDDLGGSYDQVKDLPVGLAEQGTLLAALPDLTGREVLDVGAGSGFYSRMFARRGAKRVVGVDASAGMIARAREIEERERLGIGYEVCDAADLAVLGEFDVVTAIWLLGYAEDEPTLDRMLANLTANLASGATLVMLIPNPGVDWERLDAYPKYGVSIRKTGLIRGRQHSAVRFLTDPPFEIEGGSWLPGVVEAAVARAGLVDLCRRETTIPADALARHGAGFWAELVDNPTFAVYTARRP
jgi:SAM-dependent methyltransferase